jgi:hypothetical protein
VRRREQGIHRGAVAELGITQIRDDDGEALVNRCDQVPAQLIRIPDIDLRRHRDYPATRYRWT